MPTTSVRPAAATHDGPGALDVVSLLAEVADELVVRTARDTHLAVLDRLGRLLGPSAAAHDKVHRTIASGVYAGVGAGLRAGRRGADALGRTALAPRGPALAGARGRAVHATVNGLFGDRLVRERPAWSDDAVTMRVGGFPVAPEAASLREAYPTPTRRIAVLVHGWCETEAQWDWRADRLGPGYPATLEELGWTVVRVRLNTGLDVRTNGRSLARLLDVLVAAWAEPVERVALVGHSMGGLVVHAATTAASEDDLRWVDRVTDVVTLGTPHLGAPLAAGVGLGSAGLGALPETAAFGRVLDQRSAGVRDLVRGLDGHLRPLPDARYLLVAGTVGRSPAHPVGTVLGDVLVRRGSAWGRPRRGGTSLPGADLLHLPGTHHMGLLNHPLVHGALADRLA